MKTNDIHKGMRILLRNGWYATMADNMKGNTRMADVEGVVRETGSVYAHDIIGVIVDGHMQEIEYTPAQMKLRTTVTELFGEDR
jgi:hypothetical protein